MLIAIVVFVVLLIIVDLHQRRAAELFRRELPLHAAARRWRSPRSGQTIVILSGGFDLSAGAVISLVNVVLATSMDPGHAGEHPRSGRLPASASAWLTGAFNGFFIAFLRLQPIVVTLSTMFIVQGVTLLVMDKPGGMVSPGSRHVLPRRCDPGLAADADRPARRRPAASGSG